MAPDCKYVIPCRGNKGKIHGKQSANKIIVELEVFWRDF